MRRNETEQHFLRALTQANEIVSRVKPGVEGLGIKRIDFAMLVLCEQPSPTPVLFFATICFHCPIKLLHCTWNPGLFGDAEQLRQDCKPLSTGPGLAFEDESTTEKRA